MTNLWFTLLVGGGSLLAGVLGALTGLGGGVVIVPLLTLAFGVDIRYAIGASLVSVIATSSGAAAAYVKEGYSNIRIGMVLEIATTLGALGGAALATHLPTRVGRRHLRSRAPGLGMALAAAATCGDRECSARPACCTAELNSSYPTPDGPRAYQVRAVGAGFSSDGTGRCPVRAARYRVRGGEGARDGPGDGDPIQGLDDDEQLHDWCHGGGQRRCVPDRGYIDPGLAMPVMLGVLAGSTLGARMLTAAPTRWLRLLFGAVVAILAVEMILQGVRGSL